MRKYAITVLVFISCLFASCGSYEKDIEIGNEIVEKIEQYIKDNGRYPDEMIYFIGSESDFLSLPNDSLFISTSETYNTGMVSILEIDGEVFCYTIDSVYSDSVRYTVWFGTMLGDGMYYYSDTKTWVEELS